MTRVELGAVVQIVSEEMARRWAGWRVEVRQEDGRITIRAAVDVFFRGTRFSSQRTWDLETLAMARAPRAAIATVFNSMGDDLFNEMQEFDDPR